MLRKSSVMASDLFSDGAKLVVKSDRVRLSGQCLLLLTAKIDAYCVESALVSSVQAEREWVDRVIHLWTERAAIDSANVLWRKENKSIKHVEGSGATHLNTSIEPSEQEYGALIVRLKDSPVVAIGTDFQCQVWQALMDIPAGKTVSYRCIANQVGTNGVRAVGSAIGRNPLAPLIPCHRVVRRNGELGGYRWGLDVKSALLEFENRQETKCVHSESVAFTIG